MTINWLTDTLIQIVIEKIRIRQWPKTKSENFDIRVVESLSDYALQKFEESFKLKKKKRFAVSCKELTYKNRRQKAVRYIYVPAT